MLFEQTITNLCSKSMHDERQRYTPRQQPMRRESIALALAMRFAEENRLARMS
jgi:hypothetical protein